MSAWIVERKHIDVMLNAGIRLPNETRDGILREGFRLRWQSEQDGEYDRELDYRNADEIGRMLWIENVCSVAARYPDVGPDSRPGPCSDDIDGEAIAYTFSDPGYVLTPGETLKAVACFEYQSCEHEGWDSSEAKRFCQSLAAEAASMLWQGPWGWDAADIAEAREGTVVPS